MSSVSIASDSTTLPLASPLSDEESVRWGRARTDNLVDLVQLHVGPPDRRLPLLCSRTRSQSVQRRRERRGRGDGPPRRDGMSVSSLGWSAVRRARYSRWYDANGSAAMVARAQPEFAGSSRGVRGRRGGASAPQPALSASGQRASDVVLLEWVYWPAPCPLRAVADLPSSTSHRHHFSPQSLAVTALLAPA